MNAGVRDLTGLVFGRLKVVALESMKAQPDSGYLLAWWLCYCDCGGAVSVRTSSLSSGNTSSCGCRSALVRRNFLKDSFGGIRDLTGKTFTRLTVIAIEKIEKKKVYWLCRCSCGTWRSIVSNHLTRGVTRSCGCLQKDVVSGIQDIIGHRYGRLTVIALDHHYTGQANKSRWICRCSCGVIISSTSSPLATGNTRSCGCLKRETAAKALYAYRKKGHPVVRSVIDRSGYRYGKLKVIALETIDVGLAVWIAKCDCGSLRAYKYLDKFSSCGCVRKQKKPKVRLHCSCGSVFTTGCKGKQKFCNRCQNERATKSRHLNACRLIKIPGSNRYVTVSGSQAKHLGQLKRILLDHIKNNKQQEKNHEQE